MGQVLSSCLNPEGAAKPNYGFGANPYAFAVKPAPVNKAAPPPVKEEVEDDEVKPPENVTCPADIDFSWPRDFKEKYTVEKGIGQGCFADVSLAKSVENGLEVAVKVVPKQKVFEDYSLYEDIKREASIMELMNHCLNTCTLYGKFEDETGVILVMELCTGKDLFEHLRSHEYSERSAARVAREVLRMLAACHHRGVVHRDLKPENLIFARDNADAPLKVIDFGLSVYCKAGQTLDELVGTPFYMAPEAIKGKFCQKSELWALGCILYKLLSGRDPFMRPDLQQCLTAIAAGNVDMEAEPWPQVSEEGKAFVRLLLTKDPDQRPTALQALENEWVMREESAAGEAQGLDDTIIQRLQLYSDMKPERRAALSVIASKLGSLGDQEQAIQDARRLFRKMDKSGDGRLSRDEFEQGLKENGYELSDHEINLLADQLCLEDDQSSITFTRFLTFACPWEQMSQRPALLSAAMRTAFQEMDADGSGSLDVEEIKAYLDRRVEGGSPLAPRGMDTRQQAQALMELLDMSHTGHVTLRSLERAIQQIQSKDNLPVDAYESRLPKEKPWKLKPIETLRRVLSRASSRGSKLESSMKSITNSETASRHDPEVTSSLKSLKKVTLTKTHEESSPAVASPAV